MNRSAAKKYFLVVFTMALSFLSLIGVIIVAKPFGVTPSDFRDPDRLLNVGPILVVLAILLVPILITLVSQKLLLKGSQKSILPTWNSRDFTKGVIFGLVIKGIALAISLPLASGYTASFAVAGASITQWGSYFLWFLVALFLNSLNEELAYRSFPIANLQSNSLRTRFLLVVWTSAIFSVFHFIIEPPELLSFLYRFAFGVLAGTMYVQTSSLWTIVGLHTGWNFVSLTASERPWQTGTLVNLTGVSTELEYKCNFVVLLIASIAFLFWMRRKSRHHV